MENKVGSIIRAIRLSKGISATFMAKSLKYKAVSSYTRIEKDETPVTLEQSKVIADLLGVNVNEFFNEKNLRESRTSSA
ncbi:helix-turn-helix domain-containing protein [Paenibacillus sp. HWE-109]|uniref:helix-turn-helix domain-containing protein n=1 Tax=Paenibacillus sp. HWE-109 TaxID=1306526 RepID=UPI001EDE5EC6|nr:helix-turn-helix transcriptional regulator [Paenibacillus sp. HWE-109]UKS27169.1 helix-turn-helix domain-containing protein [Paenibacillus sp. HWE-109]